jgi:hypothetical protein
LSSSSHFPLMLYSKFMKPVTLPPGRARLSTKPPPTGSPTTGNTTGTVRVACSNAPTLGPVLGQLPYQLSARETTYNWPSMLHALVASLQAFEQHRELIVDRLRPN